MAGACSCESCLGKACGRFEAFEGFEAGQTAGLNALKNRWLGRVAARVALERPAEGFEAFEGFVNATRANPCPTFLSLPSC